VTAAYIDARRFFFSRQPTIEGAFHACQKFTKLLSGVRFWQSGEEQAEPLQGQAVFYFGSRFRQFDTVFSVFGCTLPGRADLKHHEAIRARDTS
jgi:hypothetical protein